ncbi:MAG TPA: MFS transporter [Chloroflexota bacterium]|nr:MFS transporter [Chloroflexota bacterium]
MPPALPPARDSQGARNAQGARGGPWTWGVLDSLAGALWSGPTGAFLAAFAVELGAGGGQLGLFLALNTLLANGLQLYGSQWTGRGRTQRRVYAAAIISRGTWLLAGALPAALALAGRTGWALTVFLAALIVSAVGTALAGPAMGARASTAVGESQRTRYLADRMMALWLGALLGTLGMTGLLAARPGVMGYAIGFGTAALVGLAGLGAYTALLRAAQPPDGAAVARARFAPVAERLEGDSEGDAGLRIGLQAADDPAPARPPVPQGPPSAGWWPRVARRLGVPPSPALGQLVFAAAILQGGASMIGPASPIWLVRHLGAPTSYLGTVSLASSLAAIASQRVWARGIERWGPDRTLGYAATGAALIPLGWMLVWQPWVALVLSAYGGLAWGGYTLAMTARLLQLAPEAERPVYLGTYAAAVGASGAIGSLIAGAITQAVPVTWIPLVFFLSFLVRGLGMIGLRRGRP